VTQFGELFARNAFPCFDEPGWKTPWQITLDVPATQVAASNNAQGAETPLANGMKRVSFAKTQPLPPYLVAFAVGPFDVVDGGTAGRNRIAVRYLAPKGRGGEMRYAKEITPRLIDILEDYFGIPYPFEKLDSVSIPQTVNFGAMENAGMITYASQLLLAKPFEETPAFRRNYARVAAHEIAHQWFGNLVTPQWWNDVWLNEAFATWMAAKVIYQFDPSWDDGRERASSRSQAVALDRLASARRVANPVDSKGDVDAAFDSITYQKGGQVLNMFEQALTAEKFRAGVRRYLTKHARGNATAQDFMTALGEAAGPGSLLAAQFRGFIEQPGVPLIDVSLDCRGPPTLKLAQQRLRPVGSRADGREAWSTPACFRYGSGGKLHSTCTTVANGASVMPLPGISTCPDWLLANAGGVGYYVARYDPQLTIRTGRHAVRLPVPDSVALLADAALLVESGLLPVSTALTLADQYAAHASPVVRQAMAELVKSLRSDWLTPPEQRRLQLILKRQIVPEARKIDWREKSGEDERVKTLRAVLLPLAADQGGDIALRREAVALAQRWLVRREDIAASMADAVLNTAGAFADSALFDTFERAAFATEDHGDRSKLLKALALTRAPAQRERALGLALDARLSGRDVLALIDAALEDDNNRIAAFAYLRKHFDAISARLPPDTVGNFISTLGHACAVGQRDAFNEFFKERSAKIIGGPQRFAQSLERIELCIAARAAPSLARGVAQVTTTR
jgi:alanyl aminopeptidase